MWLCIYLGMTLELRLSAIGFECWLDQTAKSITKESMRDGVEASKVFLLFLSRDVLTRPFCVYEIKTALTLQKRVMLMHETDGRHGAFDFGAAEVQTAQADIAQLMSTHESLPWRRRRFEQDCILQELVSNSGLEPPANGAAAVAKAGSVSGTSVEAGASPSMAGSDDGMGLAPVPSTVPVLPEAFSPRSTDQSQVIDVLLGRTPSSAGKTKVLAHGMGGLGKTTLAASIARHDQVRSFFGRIAWISAGQEPAALELLSRAHEQLVGSAIATKSGAMVSSHREVLAKATAGERWLLVLDDVSNRTAGGEVQRTDHCVIDAVPG